MGTFAAAAFHLGEIPGRELESSVTERARPISELDDIDELVRTHRARLLRFVTYATGDSDLAETVAQDTLLRAYNGRATFRGDCSVNTWLTGIALNLLRDHQRTGKFKFWKKIRTTSVDVQEMASFIPSGVSSPEDQLLAREKVKHLKEIIQTLSPKQRTVFLLKFSEELPVTDISEILGMPVATVRTHLHRALCAVRTRLGAKQ
jgi:RNA polymerase sigma-70 factor, ECF subfamily